MTKRAFTDDQLPMMAADYRSGMTYREVAAKYGGGSDVSVIRALRSFGEPTRTTEQTRALREGRGVLTVADEDELVRLYRDECWNVAPLARYFKILNQRVSEVLRRRNIPMRAGGRTHPAFDTDEKCEALAAEYRRVGNIHVLAERHACSVPTVVRALRRAGQHSTAKGREAGFSASRSKGGSTYGPDWPHIREQVLDRDSHRCVSCGHPQQDRSQRLTVAHLRPVDAFDDLEQANEPVNLVTLCTRCHRGFDGNHYTEWKPDLKDRLFWPAWARQHSCANCGGSNVVSVPLAAVSA